ncbi:MAG TPA: oligosaccharide flippase family protein, partial [Schlesneria sp.]
MTEVHRPILFTALERYGSFLFFVVSAAILARLLSPEEYGIFALVSALTSVVVAYFQEFGGANYLIQKPSLSERNIRTAFTVTLIMSFLVAAILFGLRDVAAHFFSQDGMRVGLALCALNFLLTPVPVTIASLLRREMAFGTLARCNLAANFGSSLSSVVLAAAGYSFMAPILGAIVGTLISTVILLGCRRSWNIFRPSLNGYREVFEFGAYSSAVIIINVFYQWSPQLMLARILDFTAVGLYSRAVSITQVFDKLVLQAVNPVIMPAIAAHARSGGDLKKTYLDAISLISVLHWPFLLFIAMLSNQIILVWLGPTWIEIVPLVRVLCIASLALFAACLTYPILVTVGRVRDTLIASLISLPPSLLIVFVAASSFGVQGVAASALVTLPFQAFVAIFFICKRLSLNAFELLHAMLKSIFVTACVVASVLISNLIANYGGAGPIAGLALGSIFAAAAWSLGLLLTNHPLLAQIRAAVNTI